jgi:hypothetical protein
VSVVTAIKVTLGLCLLAVPLATAFLLRALGANRYLLWIAFPIAQSFSFYWGFLNYIVATPLAIALFAFSIGHARQPLTPKRFVAAAALSLALFLTHALAWAFAMAVAVAIVVAETSWSAAARRVSAFFVILPLVGVWASFQRAAGTHVGITETLLVVLRDFAEGLRTLDLRGRWS